MSDRRYELFLFDIFIAICKIEFVSSKFDNADELLYDFISWDSIIREFEIIGEATNITIKNNLVDKKYRMVVDFRNKIIHHYFGIDTQAVWSIIYNELPTYKEYIISKIKNIKDDKLYQELLNSTIEDNKRYPHILDKINFKGK